MVTADCAGQGSTRFNELSRGLPGLSRSLFAKRLRHFEEAGLVRRQGAEYRLTESGKSLKPIVFGLGEWGARWMFGEPEPEELDAELLIWWMHSKLDMSDWPGARQVIHIRFGDDSRLVLDRRRGWCAIGVSDRSRIRSRCHDQIGCQLRYRVWVGHLPLKQALRSGQLEFVGPAASRRRMPETLKLSEIAPAVRAVLQP
jgi:DNA-binding HxlR family transcriptional regulator